MHKRGSAVGKTIADARFRDDIRFVFALAEFHTEAIDVYPHDVDRHLPALEAERLV